jgi:hypothetical protein
MALPAIPEMSRSRREWPRGILKLLAIVQGIGASGWESHKKHRRERQVQVPSVASGIASIWGTLSASPVRVSLLILPEIAMKW